MDEISIPIIGRAGQTIAHRPDDADDVSALNVDTCNINADNDVDDVDVGKVGEYWSPIVSMLLQLCQARSSRVMGWRILIAYDHGSYWHYWTSFLLSLVRGQDCVLWSNILLNSQSTTQ